MYFKLFNCIEICGCSRDLCVTETASHGVLSFRKLEDGFVFCAFSKQLVVSCTFKSERRWRQKQHEQHESFRKNDSGP